MNKDLNKTLMIHHNIMDMWTWMDGYVDGNKNFLDVSIREAKEETELKNIKPTNNNIVSLYILPVSHHKKTEFILILICTYCMSCMCSPTSLF